MDLKGLNASLLHDAVERIKGHQVSESMCCKDLRPIGRQPALVGPAHTIRLSRAIKLDGQERARVMGAYDAVPAGAVVAIEVVGNLGGGVVGDVVAHRFKRRGALAAVVDGCIRDVIGIEQYGVPVWTRDISMAGMVPSEVIVEVGVPINLGGVAVTPGDLIAADMDGVFVCPRELIADAVILAREFLDSENKTHEGLVAGKTIVEAYPSKAKPSAKS